MKETLKIIGFILVFIGSIGLVTVDFFFSEVAIGSRNLTLIFAAIDTIGLAILVLAYFGMRKRNK